MQVLASVLHMMFYHAPTSLPELIGAVVLAPWLLWGDQFTYLLLKKLPHTFTVVSPQHTKVLCLTRSLDHDALCPESSTLLCPRFSLPGCADAGCAFPFPEFPFLVQPGHTASPYSQPI